MASAQSMCLLARTLLTGAVLIVLCSRGHAGTVQQLLASNRIPVESWSAAELAVEVQNSVLLEDANATVLAYETSAREDGRGLQRILRLDKARGTVRKALIETKGTQCAGGLGGMFQAGDFILLSIHLSPSAECQLVFDQRMVRRRTLYGFGPRLVEGSQVLLTENLIHFAPVHSERVQLVDVVSGRSEELYPPLHDALRQKLAKQNAAHMPPREICENENDPCDPERFDETVLGIAVGGADRFTLIVEQSVSHVRVRGAAPETDASQHVLYSYRMDQGAWKYCQQELSASEAKNRTQASSGRPLQFGDTATRCSPTIPVEPDTHTAR